MASAISTSTRAPVSSTGGESYAKPWYAWYVIAVLLLANLCCYLARMVIILLVQPISAAFRIGDTQISLLQGAAFSVFFVLCGLPLGWLVDRFSRRNILVFAILVWSSMAILCGLAASYGELFLARVGLGIGEAALTPAALSIIADYFPATQRGRAVSTYYLGALFGTGAATTIGAVLLRHLDAGLQLPLLQSLSPWQALFCLSGAPGFLVAVLLLAVGEPPRHEARAKTAPQASSGAEVRAREPAILRFMKSKKRAFFSIYVSLSMMQLVGFAMTAWSIPLLVRRVGMTTPGAGTIFGLLLIAVGVLAAVSGGILSDRLAASSRSGGRLRALLVCYVSYAPGIVILALAHTPAVAIGALALTIFGSCMAASMMYTVVNDIVPNRLRGQAVALASMVMTLVGATLGPTAVALVTDHVFKDPGMVGYSMLIVAFPCLAVGLGFTLYGLPHYSRARRDLAEIAAVSG